MPNNIGEQHQTVDMNMETDIRKIKTYVISVNTASDRRNKMTTLLNQNGFNNWEFVDAVGIQNRSDYWIGCGLSHKITLDKAIFPCLILEDDVGITEWFDPIQKLPQNAVTYFGISSWGLKNGFSENFGSVFEIIDENINVIKYMCSTHAIYYSDEEIGKQFSNGIIEQLFIKKRPFDEYYAMMQLKHKTYSLNKPLFYQNCDLNKIYTYFKNI
jgi:GR25 family glycosyltransferase involved in LPS biosynthesis